MYILLGFTGPLKQKESSLLTGARKKHCTHTDQPRQSIVFTRHDAIKAFYASNRHEIPQSYTGSTLPHTRTRLYSRCSSQLSDVTTSQQRKQVIYFLIGMTS